MKKIVFITLLSISVTAIALTSGHSQQSGIASAAFTNIADTTPTTHHHVMAKKMVHDSTTHKATTKTKAKTKTTKPHKPAKDSTTKK